MSSVRALALLNHDHDPDPPCKAPHFYKIILSHAHLQSLEIPVNFMKMHGKDLSNVIYLNIPNGAIWRVELLKRNGGAWLDKGWEEFVSFYSIVLGHFLLFRYDGKGCFHVVIFDMTACEVEYPSQTSNSAFEENNGVYGIAGQDDAESNDLSIEILGGSSPDQAKDKDNPVSRGQKQLDMYGIRERDGAFRYNLRNRTVGTLPDWPDSEGGSWRIVLALETSIKENVKPPLSETKVKSQFCKRKKRGSKRMKAEKPTLEGLGSGIRVAWPSQKWWRKVGRHLALSNEAAISAASRHVSKFPSFMMVMTEAYIRIRALYLPGTFVKKYIRGKTREIYLQVYKRLWPVKMHFFGCYRSRLGTEWGVFMKDINLQVGDVCVFELIKLPVVTLNVIIYRCRSA